MRQTAWLGFGALGALAAMGLFACTSVLGDFDVSGAPAGDGGGADAKGAPDGQAGDGGAAGDGGGAGKDGGAGGDGGDAAAGSLVCDFLPSSVRPIAPLPSEPQALYDDVAIFDVSGSSVRVLPRIHNTQGQSLDAYTFRSDQPGAPQHTTVQGVGFDDARHNVAQQRLDVLASTSANGTNNVAIYSLADSDNNPGFNTVSMNVFAQALPNDGYSRATFTPLAQPNEYFILYQHGGNNGTPLGAAIAHVVTTSGNNAWIEACSPTTCATTAQQPGGQDMLVPILGASPPGVFAFGSQNNFPSTDPLYQWQFPPNASSPGTSRGDLGQGLSPIAALPVQGGTQMLMASGQVNGGTLALSLLVGVIPDAKFGSFTKADLTTVINVETDLDKTPVGNKTGLASYPGGVAVLGPGAKTTSTGLNFYLFDTSTGEVLAAKAGTGANLLVGKNTISRVAMAYAPSPLVKTAFDVAWVEHFATEAGAGYDQINYGLLQCDPQ